jgi:hypothetical protein
MLRRLKALWRRFRALEPGERFQTLHREQKSRSTAVKAAFLALAIASFAVGVVLTFVPGPAVLFFALGGALLATQSRRIARGLDAGEVWGRETFRRRRRRAS